jgi:uncharacterized protein (DUF433 family)
MAAGANPRRVRVQFDLRAEQAPILDLLEQQLGSRSRADLLEAALSTLLWLVTEQRRGRKIVSIDPSELPRLQHAVELAGPPASLPSNDLYEHLVARPHPWRRQLSLKGRNLTVGQLLATMHADHLTPEEAAEELDLPLGQVREALVYYQANRDLVDAELREDRAQLAARGFSVEPPPVSR